MTDSLSSSMISSMPPISEIHELISFASLIKVASSEQWIRHTIKSDGYFIRRNNFHRYRLLVC